MLVAAEGPELWIHPGLLMKLRQEASVRVEQEDDRPPPHHPPHLHLQRSRTKSGPDGGGLCMFLLLHRLLDDEGSEH